MCKRGRREKEEGFIEGEGTYLLRERKEGKREEKAEVRGR